MKLKDTQCRTAAPKEKPWKLSDGHGLYLLVMPNGAKYWRLQYSYLGKSKTLALGVYPELGLKDARDKQYTARRLIRDEGRDPSFVRKEERLTRKVRSVTLFKDVMEEWLKGKEPLWCARHAHNVRSRLQTGIVDYLGKVPISVITPTMVWATIEKIQGRGRQDLARRTLQYAKQVFTYANSTGRIGINPAGELHCRLKYRPTEHFRSIDPRHIPEFITALNSNEARLNPQTRLATKLLMLTFVRTKELIEATWDEFDFESATWYIKAERMKKRKEHLVPLSSEALVILKRLKEEAQINPFVFPHRSHGRKHISHCTVLNAIKRIGYKGVMTGHGFRSLAMSTIKEKFGTPHEVIDRQLSHVPKKVDKAYDRAMFLDQRREMMQQWGDYLEKAGL